ncbi:MAG TPA: geranylgeranylglycerol-phosphate geranylgeranyltransferase [Flavisolibacter sp.]|nr:geranylgeranylglycerol-phosphate geranylgeranyltransferase [Flavisolibacter sp.]
MKIITAFFQLVRWPNLLFIALTQLLFYYCIYLPLYEAHDVKKIVLLIIASVFIAAAGYIINDYFDLNIDQVNKPDKNVIDKVIHRRSAIVWHFILSFSGIIITAFAVGFSMWYLIAANMFCVMLLWFYSTSFKRQLLIGNFVISILTAWTVLILFFAFAPPESAFKTPEPISVKFFRLAFLYGGFAFIISLIREAIKDMEDLEGDAKYACRTLPIVVGIRSTKLYVIVWVIVLIATLVILQLYILQFGWWHATVYGITCVILPLIYLLLKIRQAKNISDFALASKWSKIIMLSGILSMVFFPFYF